jgi:hypothetical protein
MVFILSFSLLSGACTLSRVWSYTVVSPCSILSVCYFSSSFSCQIYENDDLIIMELGSIIPCISTIKQKIVHEVRCPTEHYSLRALHNYYDDSCWSLLFSTLPQQLERHDLVDEPYHVVIDISKHNSLISSVHAKIVL